MPYCQRCNIGFGSHRALAQHEQDSNNHHICNQCDIDFSTWAGLKEHWVQSPYHVYCQYCNEHYDHLDDIEEHYEEYHHYCSACRCVFRNDVGLREHYRQSKRHHYCISCDRHFQSASNLDAHLNSSVHRQKTVMCRLGCGKTFVTNSAMLLHLEGGTCSSGMTRSTVNQFVRQYDTSNFITDPSRLLTGASETQITHIASDAAWNGRAFECYLCHSQHPSLKGLNQHLSSPKHEDQIYVCPGPSCRTRFSTLSGLVQHIESERCDVLKFKVVQRGMESLFGTMGRLGYR
ncbi:hypothetical protein CPB83DRAFT_760326 [Crepidotus variabilis]|uniref:C2H2-type domain-containing protein n=1 Tax=Crepidotus variabilis TaxID=179855 RepID=A0A9P6JTA0_9AGAR|nr:hypothetical protein CPB83DRAFT_760326 [Crepidotus variabilis]